MANKLADLLPLLSCPDDGGSLRCTTTGLHCNECGRHFPVYDDNCVELLPSSPTLLPLAVGDEYRNNYLTMFSETFRDDTRDMAWGAEESTVDSWMQKRRRQVRAVCPLVTKRTASVRPALCDIAAGAGHYTFAYAQYFHRVLHCDLSVHNLNYARRKARERNIGNIFFLRIDYFRSPFRHSIDRILCLDTVIRGKEHDRLLLNAIVGTLSRNGKAVVDFHNWWHNPLRRMGLLKENFVSNRSYSRKSAESLLADAGIVEFEYYPFCQEFDTHGRFGAACARLMQPTRHVYSFGAGTKLTPGARITTLPHVSVGQ
jgi:SAM-dependent methyltransferase